MIWILYTDSGEIVGTAADADWAIAAAGGALNVLAHFEEIDIRHYTVVAGKLEKKPESVIDDETTQREYDQAARLIRFKRGRLLSKSDWTQAQDAPVDSAVWAAYRQALRDVPQQTGFPHNVNWPEIPA